MTDDEGDFRGDVGSREGVWGLIGIYYIPVCLLGYLIGLRIRFRRYFGTFSGYDALRSSWSGKYTAGV